MSFRYTVLALGLVAACTGDSVAPSAAGDALGNAVRDAGFHCERVVAAEALVEGGDTWRVSCADAQAYLASREENGDVCVEPVRFVDSIRGGRINLPDARCIAGVAL